MHNENAYILKKLLKYSWAFVFALSWGGFVVDVYCLSTIEPFFHAFHVTGCDVIQAVYVMFGRRRRREKL